MIRLEPVDHIQILLSDNRTFEKLYGFSLELGKLSQKKNIIKAVYGNNNEN